MKTSKTVRKDKLTILILSTFYVDIHCVAYGFRSGLYLNSFRGDDTFGLVAYIDYHFFLGHGHDLALHDLLLVDRVQSVIILLLHGNDI